MLAGWDAHEGAEGERELALVGEGGFKHDFDERRFAGRKFPRREFEAQSAYVLARGGAVVLMRDSDA
jgi:hypothetical protein